jgi:hypothetical protein
VRPARATLALAAATTTLAITSRVSCGIVGIVVLAGCATVQLLASRRHPRLRAAGAGLARIGGLDDRLAGRSPWPAGFAAAVPLGTYVVVNWLKFGTLFSVPFDKQDLVNAAVPERLDVLARNGPDLTSVSEIPTNLFNYFRPNGIALDPLFPFVDFSRKVEVVGDPVRDIEQVYAAITPSSTLLLALSLVGLAVVASRRAGRAARLEEVRVLRLHALGTAVAVLPTLMFASVAHRYTVDFVPAMAILGAAGMYALPALLRGRTALRRGLAVGAGVVLVANVWVQLSLTLQMQRGYQGIVSIQHRSEYVQARIDWTRRLGLEPRGELLEQEAGDALPDAPIGTFLVIGDCDDLLLSEGEGWLELEFEDPGAVCEALGRPPSAGRG